MKAQFSTLSLVALSLIAVGCTASQQQVVRRIENPVSLELVRSDSRTKTDQTASPQVPVIEPSTAPATTETAIIEPPANEMATIETVAYREEEEEEDTDDLNVTFEPQIASSLFLPVPVAADLDDSDADVEPSPVPSASQGVTLESLTELALQNNPSIQQVSAAASKAAGFRAQVGLSPNPSIGYFGQEIGNEGAGGQHGIFVSQTFVRGDKLAWNQQVLGHDVNAMKWQVETQRQRVRTDIRVQFYAALAAQSRLRLAREFRTIAQKGVTISEERVAAKFGTRPDVLQSEIQLSEVDLAIQKSEFDLTAAWKELAAVVGLPDLAQSELIGELESRIYERNAETAYAQIVSESPLLASAIAQIDRARANLQRQKGQPIPNITGQFGVGGDDSTGDAYANVQFSLPLPIRNENEGNICAAHAAYCEATQNVQRLRMQIRRDLAGVMREYHVAQATVQQYENSILPKAEETMNLTQEAQVAGQFDFLRVLTARRAYFDVNIKYVTALGALAQANAKIDGLLLTGGLSNTATYNGNAGLRGQALSGQ